VLWHCWLGIRKSIRPVKLSDEVLVWLSVWSEVQIVCIWSSWYHCVPKPCHLLPHINQDWFYLSDTSLPRLSWKSGRQMGVVVVAVAVAVTVAVAAVVVTNVILIYFLPVHWPWVKMGGILPDLRSGISFLRSTISNNRSCTSQLRSGTFLLGSTTLHSLYFFCVHDFL